MIATAKLLAATLTAAAIFDPHTLVGLLGPLMAAVAAIAVAWAITRQQSLAVWKDTALGYKEQRDQMQGRLERSEQAAVILQTHVTELEARPDLRTLAATADRILAAVDRNATRLDAVEKVLRDLSERR